MYKSPKVLLLLDARAGYSRGLLHGIARYSRLHKHWLLHLEHDQVFYTPDESFYGSRTKQKALNVIKSFNPDGIIMGPPKLVDEILGMGISLICHTHATETISGIPIFVSDNFAIAKMAAEYFLSRGFTNFAYCGEYPLYYSIDRGEKFREVLSQSGFKVNIFKPPKTRSKRSVKPGLERQYITDWVKLLPKPVAILTSSDDQTRKIVSACHLLEILVPEQAAILGIDNDQLLCELSGLAISSIALNAEKAGYEAAELLDDIMAGRKKMANHEIVIKPVYVETRKSTDSIVIKDSDIAVAVRFIRDNPKRIISVGEVAEAATMSRRHLQRRFYAVLGRSVNDEIKRIRVETVKRHLAQTDLSIGGVAEILDFTNTKHLSRFFKHETGMTPREFRNNFS